MDPLRGNYPDEPESRRYRGDHHHVEPEGHAWFETQAEEGHRYAGRAGGRATYGGPPAMMGQAAPATGEHRPLPVDLPPQRDQAQHWDPSMASAAPHATREARRAAGRSAAQSSAARTAGRGAAGVLTVVAAVAVALPVVRLLFASAFGPTLSASGVVSAVLVLLALPLGVIGLHGLTSDAARSADPPAYNVWFRPPVAYLTVALVLIVAAGLAA